MGSCNLGKASVTVAKPIALRNDFQEASKLAFQNAQIKGDGNIIIQKHSMASWRLLGKQSTSSKINCYIGAKFKIIRNLVLVSLSLQLLYRPPGCTNAIVQPGPQLAPTYKTQRKLPDFSSLKMPYSSLKYAFVHPVSLTKNNVFSELRHSFSELIRIFSQQKYRN